MRVKQIWQYIPIPAKLKLLTDRITFSRLTVAYVVFSLLHCVVQIAFQVEAFKINANAAKLLNDIISQGNATVDGFTVLGSDLRVCDHVPSSIDTSDCKVLWDGRSASSTKTGTAASDNVATANSKVEQSAASSYMSLYASSPPLSASTTVVSVSTLSSAPASSSVASSAVSSAVSSSAASSAVSSAVSSSAVSSALSSLSSSESTSASTSVIQSTIVLSSTAESSSTSVVSSTSSSSSSRETTSSVSTSAAAQTQSSVAPSTSTSQAQRTQSTVVTTPSSTRTVFVTSTQAAPSPPPVATKVEDDDDDDSDDEDDDDSDSEDGDDSDDEDDDLRKRDIPRVVLAVAADGQTQVKIDGLVPGKEVTLTKSCLWTLNWPVAKVDNTKREDLVFIGFSVWVLGMSFVAILNESPPHIVASFLTHVLATAWSGFQIAHTNSFRADFSRLTTHGACGINLLPTYWDERARFEIPTLAMNVLGLVISAILSWKLMKSFGWQTFKRIGASLAISRAYRSILIFSITIQLSVFFIVVAVALWVDQVYNGDIASLTSRSQAFRAITILVLVLVIPWLSTGWISVRREWRVPMLAFLMLAFLYLVGWGAMFSAATFRWTFVQWRFFSLMAIASVLLIIATLVLGIICRLSFGKGLPRYLNAQQELPGDDFEPAMPWPEKFDDEKVAFPSYETPIPTFAAAYGTNIAAPQSAHMPAAPRVLGPRFFMNNNANINGGGAMGGQFGPGFTAQKELVRSGSQHSASSSMSSSLHSELSMKGKRWVIE